MQTVDLVALYAGKTDEELLELAADPAQLMPEAHNILAGELSRRRLNLPVRAGEDADLPRASEHAAARNDLSFKPHHAGRFIAEVVRVYHRHFWLFIKLMAPAVVIGYWAVVLSRRETSDLVRRFPLFYQYPITIAGVWLVNVAGLFISWMAFTVSFGATCSAVWNLQAGAVSSIGKSFAVVPKRWATFLRLTVVLFLLCSVAAGISGLVMTGVFWLSTSYHVRINYRMLWTVSVLSWSCCLLVLSRFALAVPAVLLDEYKVGKAMFRSDELTEGKWLTLTALLSKSVVGGYVAGMLPYWLVAWLPHSVDLPSWFSWALRAVSIAGVTVMEPPMFIGFALLYARSSRAPSVAEGVLVPHVV